MKKHLLGFLAFVIVVAAFPGSANAAAVKEWTFLVFLNGHNSLDSFGAQNIRGMEQVGSSDKVNIVVQWASMANKTTQRLLIEKSTDPSKVTSHVIENLPTVDMGDYKELINFVDWGVKNFPAQHYFVNVWNHGNGWHLQNTSETNTDFHPTDISYDDRTGHHISTEQLGQAMGEISRIIGHKVDVYGSDACLMAMAEVASEMVDSVDYFVGSEEVEPGEGWPYETFLLAWNKMSDSSPREVAKLLSKQYLAAYSGGIYGDKAVTMSAMDLSQLPTFNKSMGQLSAELLKLNVADFAKTLKTAKTAQDFALSDYKDLGDFLIKMGQTSVSKTQAAAMSDVQNAMGKLVISNDASPSFKAHGVAIWLPTSSYEYSGYSERYEGLKFNREANWGAFLKVLNK
jgi:hypothetical protein